MVTRIIPVRAPNPSAMTLDGTNSYLIDGGNGRAICIDPGPPIERHVTALLDCAASHDLQIETILVTHGHPDHWPAAVPLAKATGAKIAAHVFAEFSYDRTLGDGDRVGVGDVELQVIDAPGHSMDHLVFYEPRERALFTGDVILGKGTVVIAPPNGSMRPYQRTLARLAGEFSGAQYIFGGHGPIVTDAQAKIREYIEHRRLRENELLAELSRGPQTIPELVGRIYAGVEPILWPAAARQMLAYLIPLEDEGRVRSTALPRELTAGETAILNPAWETIVGKEQAATIEAELGAMLRIDIPRMYELA
jgi:glyoxylase-like metal-dependent hydrolase (beta-lactamase superfamily II)